jgi:hypothetical protein
MEQFKKGKIKIAEGKIFVGEGGNTVCGLMCRP